jgi:Zn-dependent peptidase ImmA (M78 family)/DNA-binding XRE family transcriptional regulator
MNTNILDTIDMRELGKKLQQARIKRGMTQEDAAKVIDVARTTIIAIEKGERRIKAGELIKLAQAYGHQVNDFVRPAPKIEPFQVQFRGSYTRTGEDATAIATYIDELERLCHNYLELEQITGSPLMRKYPLEYEIAGLRMAQAAESVAIEERNRLGLGDGPIPILRDILEQDVGLRIFYLPLHPSEFSAIYLYTEQLGGCIAINSLHPEERRRWSLAHDYAHFLVHRYKPTVFIEEGYQRLPESERFADSFALYFLMPTAGLTRRFNDIQRMKGKITPADLCTLAHYYGVSVAAITLRLEDLNLLPTGIWDKLREGGFKVREAQRQLGLAAIPARDEKLPIRYQYLAVDAFDRALISEGQFARFLGVDRLEARRVAEILRQHTQGVTDDSTIDLDMTQSLGA